VRTGDTNIPGYIRTSVSATTIYPCTGRWHSRAVSELNKTAFKLQEETVMMLRTYMNNTVSTNTWRREHGGINQRTIITSPIDASHAHA
jgi:hypothetical protein